MYLGRFEFALSHSRDPLSELVFVLKGIASFEPDAALSCTQAYQSATSICVRISNPRCS